MKIKIKPTTMQWIMTRRISKKILLYSKEMSLLKKKTAPLIVKQFLQLF